jgi:hypothetical protein
MRPAGCRISTARRLQPSMRCHLGLCRSFRSDVPLEPFTRGPASEDADQHAQRFVAVIAQRSLPCYASKSAISLPSRPDLNAAAPRVVDLCIRAQRVREPTGGHHVIAGPGGAASARSSPSARQGRSDAEWLDRAKDRRTIRARDGRIERPRGRSAARTYETNETRRLENRKEVTAR